MLKSKLKRILLLCLLILCIYESCRAFIVPVHPDWPRYSISGRSYYSDGSSIVWPFLWEYQSPRCLTASANPPLCLLFPVNMTLTSKVRLHNIYSPITAVHPAELESTLEFYQPYEIISNRELDSVDSSSHILVFSYKENLLCYTKRYYYVANDSYNYVLTSTCWNPLYSILRSSFKEAEDSLLTSAYK